MKEREIGTGASCFLIKDKTIANWEESHIRKFLVEEGFINWGKAKSHKEIDWLYVNIYSKVYSKGMYGVGLTRVVGDHAITFEEFLTIYNIYKKYDDFVALSMNKEEQEEFDKNHPLYRMEKIIGCKNLTHEILHDYISTGWWEREMLPWEHCGKTFSKVYCKMSRECLKYDIHFCRYNDKPYYFGLGLEEPEVTDDMLENGYWAVYTWSD